MGCFITIPLNKTKRNTPLFGKNSDIKNTRTYLLWRGIFQAAKLDQGLIVTLNTHTSQISLGNQQTSFPKSQRFSKKRGERANSFLLNPSKIEVLGPHKTPLMATHPEAGTKAPSHKNSKLTSALGT